MNIVQKNKYKSKLFLVFLAGAVILLMLALVTWMTIWFRRIRSSAGLLNIPYVLWTAYASYLTLGILKLNS